MAYFERQHFCNFVALDRKRTDMSIYHCDECYDFNCYAGTYHTDSITYFFLSLALSLKLTIFIYVDVIFNGFFVFNFFSFQQLTFDTFNLALFCENRVKLIGKQLCDYQQRPLCPETAPTFMPHKSQLFVLSLKVGTYIQ